jgi:ribonuclease P protein subunit RPR2
VCPNLIYGCSYSLSGGRPLPATLGKVQAKEIARERIDILVKVALQENDEALAARQALQAKKIAMRFRVRLPYEARQLFCKKCKAFIVPGRSARVRVGRAKTRAVRITCLRCGHIYRKILGSE